MHRDFFFFGQDSHKLIQKSVFDVNAMSENTLRKEQSNFQSKTEKTIVYVFYATFYLKT